MKDHPAATHPDLLVGMGTADDAGVFALGDGRALVQTVDFFTPVVDDPRDWGRIAAANALSDVYAMGGKPLTGLQYLAWPRDELPFEMAGQVIEGGMDVMAEAGVTVVGGHSIDSLEPVYGFAVTGLVDVESVVSNAGAQPGDVLVLTKPLGTGIITTAIKRGKCPAELESSAIELMSALNETASTAMRAQGAHAATDVTGFGLLGHLIELCQASDVGAEVIFNDVPVMNDVRRLLEMGMWAGGSQRNYESVRPRVKTELGDDELRLLADAQTSGGLLVAVPEDGVRGLVATVDGARAMGRITADPTIRVM